jgi:hypothetical protein
LSGRGRVSDGGGVYSMLQFQLEGRDDGTKRCRKIKMRQRARLGSMGKKRDMAWWCGNVGQRRGGTVEGKKKTTSVGLT